MEHIGSVGWPRRQQGKKHTKEVNICRIWFKQSLAFETVIVKCFKGKQLSQNEADLPFYISFWEHTVGLLEVTSCQTLSAVLGG